LTFDVNTKTLIEDRQRYVKPCACIDTMDPDGLTSNLSSGDGCTKDPPPGNGSHNAIGDDSEGVVDDFNDCRNNLDGLEYRSDEKGKGIRGNNGDGYDDDDGEDMDDRFKETKADYDEEEKADSPYHDLEASLQVPVIPENYELESHQPPFENPLDLELLRGSYGDPNEKLTYPMKYMHRTAFNKLAFGHAENSKKIHFTSKCWTDEKYNGHISIMSQWSNPDPAARKRFRNKFKNGYSLISRCKLDVTEVSNGSRQFLLQMKTSASTNHAGTVIIPQSRVFDAIYSAHQRVGHQNVAATYSCTRRVFWNVSQKQCAQFIETCHGCSSEKPRNKEMKVNSTPIRSARFRDRMQVGLVDMRTCRRKNPFGVMMQYIVVCKDHFTGFLAAACIPRKRASFVAYVLTEIFGVIGFPLILHIDNSKEFTGKEILDLIKQKAPYCTTVTGQPMTPSDQGSVKNMTYQVRKALYAFEQQDRNNGKEPNWTKNIGQMVTALNSKKLKGMSQVPPYEAVFGIHYHDPEHESVETLRLCSTVRERWNLKKESKFKEMIRGNGWTKAYNFNEKDMEPDDSYWSDDDDILNDLQELPLEDPDKDENIPKCRKSEHAPKIGSSDTVAVPVSTNTLLLFKRKTEDMDSVVSVSSSQVMEPRKKRGKENGVE
jgi:hypothetical protein